MAGRCEDYKSQAGDEQWWILGDVVQAGEPWKYVYV